MPTLLFVPSLSLLLFFDDEEVEGEEERSELSPSPEEPHSLAKPKEPCGRASAEDEALTCGDAILRDRVRLCARDEAGDCSPNEGDFPTAVQSFSCSGMDSK